MKLKWVGLAALLLGWSAGLAGAAAPPWALSAAQRERLKEGNRLGAEAPRLWQAGQQAEAVAAWQKKVDIDREVFGDSHEVVARSLEVLAQIHEAREAFAEARKARQEITAIRSRLYGPRHWRVTDARLALEMVGRLQKLDRADRRLLRTAGEQQGRVMQLYGQGKPKEALALAEQLRRSSHRLVGEGHPLYAQSLNNLAFLYKEGGDYGKAVPLSEEVRDITRKALGEGHPDYASSLNNLALLYQHKREYGKAQALLEQARAIRKEALGEAHPDYANTLNNLAELHRETGNPRKALPLYEQARDITRKALGEGHPDYAVSLHNLAVLYQDTGEYGKARPLLEQARDIRKKALGEGHPLYATTLLNLAQLYQDTGEYGEALPLYEQARDIRKKALGEGHPDYAICLNNLAQLYRDTGDYGKALPLYEQARDIARKALGEGHPDYATCLNNLGTLYHKTGDYGKALPLFEQARDIRKKVLGEGHPDYGASLNNLALLYKDLGDYGRALPLYEQARDITRKALGEGHPHYATCLNNLGTVYLDMGEYGKAPLLYEKARDITRNALGQAHPHYARSLNNLAFLSKARGDYGKALPLYEQARDITKATLGEGHPEHARSLNNLGSLYLETGDYGKALPLFEQARDIRKKALGEAHPEYAASLNNLAALYQQTGEYGKALPLYEKARDITNKARGEGHPDYATSLNNLAFLYKDMGDYGKALLLYEQARDIIKKARGEGHPLYARSLNNLAQLYQDTGDYGRALPLYEQARAIARKALGEAHPHYAQGLSNLARLYQETGEYGKALPLFEQARDITRKALGEGHPDYAASLNNLAALYQDTGDYAKAVTLCEKARDIRKKALGERHPEYAQSLMKLAALYHEMGEDAKAARFAHQGLLARACACDSAFAAQNARLRLELLQRYHYELDLYLSVALPARAEASEVHGHLLTWKGAVAARQAQERIAQEQPELAPLLDNLRLARAALARQSENPPRDPTQLTEWVRLLRQRESEKDALETELAGKSAPLRRARNVSSVAVANALAADAAFVDIVEFGHLVPSKVRKGRYDLERRYLGFVLLAGKGPVLVELGQAQRIDDAVASWRRTGLNSPRPDASARRLHELVWKPLSKHLGGARTVYLSPDGSLAQFPFAALPGSKPGSFLLEELTFVHLTSGLHLLELADERKTSARPGLLAIGGLDFGASKATAEGSWVPLPGTSLEAQRVAALFAEAFPADGEPRLLSGSDVDAARLVKEAVPERGPRRRFLHLATHGFFRQPRPTGPKPKAKEGPLTLEEVERLYRYDRNPLLSSGLALSGANADPGKGTLTAEEVLGLDLRRVDLAVLSACETGLGKVQGSQGVQGLQLAFHTAGVRTLAASLWHVNDAATSVLMEEFYANLWLKKMSRAEALRQAQLTVLKNPQRVQARRAQLRELLLKRGISEEELASRGLKKAVDLPDGGKVKASERRSPPAWWAAFLLSGDPGKLD